MKRTAPKAGVVTATMADKGIDARNTYKVPVKQWRKWSRIARTVFNRVYNFAINNPELILHPQAVKTTKPAHWKTIAWNAAWIAADATDDSLPDYVESI